MRKQAIAVVALVPVLAIASGAGLMVQPERDGADRPQRQRQPGGDPSAFVDRIMQADANDDGKVTRDEMGEGRATRIFDAADTDGDDALTRSEIEAFVKERFADRPGADRNPVAPGAAAPGGNRPAVTAPSGQMFHDGMETAGRAMRRLSRSDFAEETRMGDLALVQTVQRGLMDSKIAYLHAEVSREAQAKYAGDPDRLHMDLRMQLARALQATIEIEMAILEGDAKAAAALLKKLNDIQGKGHDSFEPHEDG